MVTRRCTPSPDVGELALAVRGHAASRGLVCRYGGVATNRNPGPRIVLAIFEEKSPWCLFSARKNYLPGTPEQQPCWIDWWCVTGAGGHERTS